MILFYIDEDRFVWPGDDEWEALEQVCNCHFYGYDLADFSWDEENCTITSTKHEVEYYFCDGLTN